MEIPRRCSASRVCSFWFTLALVSVVALTGAVTGVRSASGQASTVSGERIFIPVVTEPPRCEPNAEEGEISEPMLADPGQQRAQFACDVILNQVARQRAEDMATRDYLGHVNPDGVGPNFLVESAGYLLPTFYDHSANANNIESIAGGQPTAAEAWADWMESPDHRAQLLGESSFYAEQTEYGIGYAYNPNSTYKHYWVVLTAKPGP